MCFVCVRPPRPAREVNVRFPCGHRSCVGVVGAELEPTYDDRRCVKCGGLRPSGCGNAKVHPRCHTHELCRSICCADAVAEQRYKKTSIVCISTSPPLVFSCSVQRHSMQQRGEARCTVQHMPLFPKCAINTCLSTCSMRGALLDEGMLSWSIRREPRCRLLPT